jgi:lipid-binding SYLF domain-containing protein
MKSVKYLSTVLLTLLFVVGCSRAVISNTDNATSKIRNATVVFQEFNKNIPATLLKTAKAVLVIPDVGKLAIFGLGGEAGVGVLSKRMGTNGWSAPAFVNITSASAGLQMGIKSTDIVLLIMNDDSINDIVSSKFTLGVSSGVSAGPVGRDVSIDTATKIYSYSRSSGLYAGVAFEGLNLSVANDANAIFYGKNATANELLTGKVSSNSDAVRQFRDELKRVMR